LVLTTTESGKVLTRLIFRNIRIKGNSCDSSIMSFQEEKSNSYDVITLGDEIIEDSEKIIESTNLFSQ
jgi:hypothetical protein